MLDTFLKEFCKSSLKRTCGFNFKILLNESQIL